MVLTQLPRRKDSVLRLVSRAVSVYTEVYMNIKKPLRRRFIFIALLLLVVLLLPPTLKTLVGATGQQELYPISVGSFLTSVKAKVHASMLLNTLETGDPETYYYFGFSSGGWLGSDRTTKVTQVVSGKIDSITTISKHFLDSSSELEVTVTTQTSEELSEGVKNSARTKMGEITSCRLYMTKNILWNELYFNVYDDEGIYCGYKKYGSVPVIMDAGSMRMGEGVLIKDYYPGYFNVEDYLTEEGLSVN